MIYRDGSVGAAGQIVPTKGYEPPLKIDSAVVQVRDGLDSEEADSQSHRGAQWPLANKFILIKSYYAGKCCIFTR